MEKLNQENFRSRVYAIVADGLEPKFVSRYVALALQSLNNKMFDTAEEIARGLRLTQEEYYTYYVFKNWRKQKSLFILNGGTTLKNNSREESQKTPLGEMNKTLKKLKSFDIETGVYYAPEMEDKLVCIVFVTEERSFDEKKYPDFDVYLESFPQITEKFDKEKSFRDNAKELMDKQSEEYKNYVTYLGGYRNTYLRYLIYTLECKTDVTRY